VLCGSAQHHCCVGAAGYGRRRERFASQLSQALERQLEEQFYAALRRPDEERAAFSPLQAQI
jgi:hypothetical protein